MKRFVSPVGLAVLVVLASPIRADTRLPCVEGARCIRVDANGKPDPSGDLIAQCSGRFPDSVGRVPDAYAGPRFILSQEYPTELPKSEASPWMAHDFRLPESADAYMFAVRKYVYEGMQEADWRVERNTTRRWYHVPWMTLGRHPREFMRGLTEERPLTGPELGLRPRVTVQNWAVGFYNSLGAYAIGQVWKDKESPNPAASRPPEGAVVAKVLFTSAGPKDFSGADPVAGAPEWRAYIFKSRGSPEKEIRTLRLMQMDVAIRDQRAGLTGWVFGTFAYDPDSKEKDPWDRMMPVGLMWGNDPSLTDSAYQAGARPHETIVSTLAPRYAASHLGRAGRMNGPVDNPISSCLSCHSTAQVPAVAPMTPPSNCSDKQVLNWFRNLPGATPFGSVTPNACEPVVSDPSNGPIAVDYSLQVAVAIASQLAPNAVNSCSPGTKPFGPELQRMRKMPGVQVYDVER